MSRLLVSMAAMAVWGCSSDSPEFYNGTGTLSLTLAVEAWEGTPSAPVDECPAAADFRVSVAREGNAAPLWVDWPDFEQGQHYLAGPYTLTARYGTVDDEGVGRPCFEAVESATVGEGTHTDAGLTARLASAPVRVALSPELTAAWPGLHAMVHSDGGAYVTLADADATLWAYMRPGPVAVMLMMPLGDAQESRAGVLVCVTDARAGEATEVAIAPDGDRVTAVWGDQQATLDLSPEALSQGMPAVALQGAERMELPEFTVGSEPCAFSFGAPAVDRALLNINSPLLRAQGCPSSVDLMDEEDAGRAWLADRGVEMPLVAPASAADSPVTVPLDPVVALIDWRQDLLPESAFTLEVGSPAGLLMISPTVHVTTLRAEPRVAAVTGGIIGDDSAEVTVEADVDINPRRLAVTDAVGEPLPVEGIAVDGPRRCRLRLRLPEGNRPVDARLYYGDRMEQEFTIVRRSPDFTVAADAFASRVVLRIGADSDEERAFVTENVNIWAGDGRATVLSRDPQAGLITCIGLQPASRVSLALSMLPEPDDSAATHRLAVDTERDLPLPFGSFDDVKKGIKYDNLASGGLYSQTIVEIFNRQNHTDYDLRRPEGWADVNAKTFCTSSTNRNTWYMQPSSWSTYDTADGGDFAVELVTVAFDPRGEAIEPYLQEGQPYTDYSRNVPSIAYRAAGKIFLGSYAYSPDGPAETYSEGLDFASRPTSINGYYKYYPSADNVNDTGLVTIELLAADGTVVATERLLLGAATDYTAFTLPVSYPRFGVKASRLKVMVASSSDIGDIAHETAALHTVADAPSASSTGSRLLIDNLSLAY